MFARSQANQFIIKEPGVPPPEISQRWDLVEDKENNLDQAQIVGDGTTEGWISKEKAETFFGEALDALVYIFHDVLVFSRYHFLPPTLAPESHKILLKS